MVKGLKLLPGIYAFFHLQYFCLLYGTCSPFMAGAKCTFIITKSSVSQRPSKARTGTIGTQTKRKEGVGESHKLAKGILAA